VNERRLPEGDEVAALPRSRSRATFHRPQDDLEESGSGLFPSSHCTPSTLKGRRSSRPLGPSRRRRVPARERAVPRSGTSICHADAEGGDARSSSAREARADCPRAMRSPPCHARGAVPSRGVPDRPLIPKRWDGGFEKGPCGSERGTRGVQRVANGTEASARGARGAVPSREATVPPRANQ